jgi:hypothetical protein
VNRLAVGIGMIPRGEVGLIFANVGAGLMLDGSRSSALDVFGRGGDGDCDHTGHSAGAQVES